MTADQLSVLPCPFCGGDANIDVANFVYCDKCGACSGYEGDSTDDAIKAWNTRHTAVASHAKGEAVAWQYRNVTEEGPSPFWHDIDKAKFEVLRNDPNAEVRQLYTHPPRSGDEAGHVVVTHDSSGEIVAVTRQDDDGQILSVIAEKFTDDERRKFAAEHALTHMSVQAAMAARGGEKAA